MNFSATDHIEDLHQNESGEDECKVARGTVCHIHLGGVKFFALPVLSSSRVNKPSLSVVLKISPRLWNNRLASKKENEKNSYLPKSLCENVLNHLSRNYVVIFVLWHSLKQRLFWQLSRKCQCTQRIHDQVHPK